MARKEETKPMAWKSSLMGCLPCSKDASSPSAAKLQMNISKKREESSDDEDDVAGDTTLDDSQIFHKLANQIEMFLSKARTQNDNSESWGSIATGTLISSKWIDSMSGGSKIVYDKLQSTKFKDMKTTAADICQVMGKAHWAASGLLVVAAVISNIQKLKQVDKESIDLLVAVNTLARSLSRFTNLPHIPEEIELTVNRAKNAISKSAACCLSIIHSPRYVRFIYSSKNESEMSSCRKELDSIQHSLNFQLLVADYSERHESRGGSHKQKRRVKGSSSSRRHQGGPTSPKGSSPPPGGTTSPEKEKGNQQGEPGQGSEDDNKFGGCTKKFHEYILKIKDKCMHGDSEGNKKLSGFNSKIKKIYSQFDGCIFGEDVGTADINSKTDDRIEPGTPLEPKKGTDSGPNLEPNVGTDPDTKSGSDEETDTDTVKKIKEMLELEPESTEKAVAVFFCGEKHTGMKSVAGNVCKDIPDGWKSVKIDISKMETAEQRLASSDAYIISALRLKILKQLGLEPKVSEPDLEKKDVWEKELSPALRKNVFIFIRQVTSADILKGILPMNIPRGKTRVLLSIHDKSVLSALDGSVYKTNLYVMKALSYREAVKVFRRKRADWMDKPAVEKVIKICKGYRTRMRLVMQHLFKYYTDDDEDFTRLSEWIKIKQPKFGDLREYFKYEEKFLHQSRIAKDALLDICSFFNGWGWHETACIMDDDVLEKLKELQLVKRESDKVSVPPSVLAYCLSRAKGIRITGAIDLHDVILKEKKEPGKFQAIKGIWMVENKFPFHMSSSDLDKMENLRVLALGDWTTVTGKCTKTFRHLRYFRTGRLGELPFNSNRASNLRFLDNNSQHVFRWSSDEAPLTLRTVRSNTKEIVDYLDLGKLPEECQLTEMDLEGIEKEELPNTLCGIYSLQKINLSQCKNLKELPKTFGKLQRLSSLDLSHCDVLKDLSPNFGWLSSLEKVSFSYCRQLRDLPDSIVLLSSVKEIDFSYCKSIQKLPKSLVKLSTLQVLRLRGCSHLLELPEEFESLALKELYLESCKRLKALHESVGEASPLSQKTVSLSWCRSVVEISKGFINVIKYQVEELIVVDCMSLQILPDEFTELSSLKILNLSGCKSLLLLPRRFHKLQYLEMLNLSSCEKLKELPTKLSRLLSLKEVNLSNCHGLEGNCVRSLSQIQSLTYLDIHGSQKLVDGWNQLNRDKRTCQLVVTTVQPGLGSRLFSDALKNDSSIAKELKRGVYEFFNGKWIFVDINGGQFYPSTLEEGATLAVIFYDDYQIQELKALGGILDDLQATCKKLQIIHVGACVSELARELAGRHRVYGCDNYGALVFFEKALCTVNSFDHSIGSAMIVSDVVYKGSHKVFSEWTSITKESVRLRAKTTDFQKIDFLRFKELIESPKQRSNTEVLRALLLTKEIKFLISKEKQVEIEELDGKWIFLLLSWLHNMEAEYEAFKYVYENLKKQLNEESVANNVQFEVVWIPIVIEGRGTRDLHAKWMEEIEWPSIADPWSVNPMVMRYFQRHTSFDKLPSLLAVSPSGKFYSDNLIPNTTKKEAEININTIETETKHALYKFIDEQCRNRPT